MLPKAKDLASLPDPVKIYGPLINGEQWLRNFPVPLPMEGPYSSGYGGSLYAVARKEDVIKAYARARGSNRKFLAQVLGLSEVNS
jgi:hypothetical protein